MSRLYVYEPPLTMADDTRLIQLFQDAEHNRRWNRLRMWLKKWNWNAITGLAVIIGICAPSWWVIIHFLRKWL